MYQRARPDEAPSPALSHLSMKSDQSMDRPIAFSNKTPSYNGYEKYENLLGLQWCVCCIIKKKKHLFRNK